MILANNQTEYANIAAGRGLTLIPTSYPVIIATQANEYIYEQQFVSGPFIWKALINGVDYVIEPLGSKWRVITGSDMKGQILELKNARKVAI